jgi:hypothetical protein
MGEQGEQVEQLAASNKSNIVWMLAVGKRLLEA